MTVTQIDEVLERHRTGLTSDDVAASLDAAYSSIPSAGAAPLSASEVAFLAQNAGGDVAAVIEAWDPQVERAQRIKRATRQVEALISGSVSIAEAASLLQIDRSGISRRIGNGDLYTVTVNGNKRIPRWQITADNALLPGLADIVAAIPYDVPAMTIAAYMQTQQDDLDGATPTQYLTAGGSTRVVAEMVTSLGRW